MQARHIFGLVIVAALAAASCDGPDDLAVEFREAPNLVLYRSQNVKPARTASDLAELLIECDDGTPIAETFTEYPTQYTIDDLRVLGMGLSALASEGMIECYRERMIKLGATP